ncbi:hypothetical protein [Phyllobacterium sp. 22552]|uniref:hypothetical protein n=1 Tax=Phyllobacterium sp. 22552 TaxID=3453941 RepID=UPI003F87CCAF
MKIKATGYERNVVGAHKVFDAPLSIGNSDVSDMGNVRFVVVSDQIALNGRFEIAVTLSREEIRLLYEQSLTGFLNDKIDDLEQKIKSFSSHD